MIPMVIAPEIKILFEKVVKYPKSDPHADLSILSYADHAIGIQFKVFEIK